VYAGFWWGNPRERNHWGDPGRTMKDNIKMDIQEVGCGDVGIWTGLCSLRIGTDGGLL
jgi:ketosteroid isomerase-like protein